VIDEALKNRKPGEKVGIHMEPFIVKALAEKGLFRSQLDRLIYAGLPGLDEAARRAGTYNNYYREYDAATEWYCRKTAALTSLAEEESPAGEKAAAFVKDALEKCWPDAWHYIADAPEPVDFDKFYLKTVKRLMVVKLKPGQPPVPPPPPKAPGQGGWSGELAIFLYIAGILKKTVDINTAHYSRQFNQYILETERIQSAGRYEFELTEKKARTAEKLWAHLEKRFGGRVPVTLNEYYHTKMCQEDKTTNTLLFSFGNMAGLPICAMKESVVGLRRLRHEIDFMVHHLLPEDAEYGEGLERTALDTFVQALLLRALAAEQGKDRNYAIKYFDLKNKGADSRQRMDAAETAQLRKELKALRQKIAKGEELAAQKEKEAGEEAAKKERTIKELKRAQEFADRKIAEQDGLIRGLLECLNRAAAQSAGLLPPGAAENAAQLKALVIGGKDTWSQTVKDKYPGFVFVDAEGGKPGLSLIDNAEYIVVGWEYARHETTADIRAYARTRGWKLLYLESADETSLLQLLHREYMLAGG
jgi:hypothetical protein